MRVDIQPFAEYAVAPYVGAWIETDIVGLHRIKNKVAPYVGAWIETLLSGKASLVGASHPTWVRGLKLNQSTMYQYFCEVAPYVGAWIETQIKIKHLICTTSRTLRGCVD